MKCPNCGKEGVRFKDKKKLLANKGKSQRFREFGRDSNLAKCNKCNWEGEKIENSFKKISML